jgi:hypothetical protein
MFDAPIYICVQNTAFRIVIGNRPPGSCVKDLRSSVGEMLTFLEGQRILSDEELSNSRHCKRSACPERSVGKAISWPIGGLLRRLWRLAM